MSRFATLDKPTPVPAETDEAAWHRRACWVTPWLALSGDLHADEERAVEQLQGWRRAGVTDILDVRDEWTDEAFVAAIAPEIHYWWIPTDDCGGRQGAAWFHSGLAAMAEVMPSFRGSEASASSTERRVLVHCHMGVNRGPSMGLRLLLAEGCDLIDALDAIRAARPIAAVLYARDALDDHLRLTHASVTLRRAERGRLNAWQRAHPVDLGRIIGRIRRAEDR
jgi:hypothetical protein